VNNKKTERLLVRTIDGTIQTVRGTYFGTLGGLGNMFAISDKPMDSGGRINFMAPRENIVYIIPDGGQNVGLDAGPAPVSRDG
jgi:hypothetical protein